jgi:D-alanine transaminase
VSRIAYVNGRYVAHRDASVHIEDRGYQLADGIYEVFEVVDRRLVDVSRHVARLTRSLRELRIAMPMELSALHVVMREVIHRNRIRDGIVYLQVTRGVAPREHAFPARPVQPAVVVTARRMERAPRDARAGQGIRVITVPDSRWARVDIKSIGLLPNVLAKQAAYEAGATEAWFVDSDGFITEGSSTNAWILTGEGEIVTAPGSHGILSGVTRSIVLEVAARRGLRLAERSFTRTEAMAAAEAFLTSRTTAVTPVVQIDDQLIGDGKPGPVASDLRALCLAASAATRA